MSDEESQACLLEVVEDDDHGAGQESCADGQRDAPSESASAAASAALSTRERPPRRHTGRSQRRRRVRSAGVPPQEENPLLSTRVVLEVYLMCAWDLIILMITAVCCAYTIYATVRIGGSVPVVASPFPALADGQVSDAPIGTRLVPCTYPVFRFVPDSGSPLMPLLQECPMQEHYYCPAGYACYSDSIGHPTYTTCALVNSTLPCDVEQCKLYMDTLEPLTDAYIALRLDFVGPGVGDNVKFVMATVISTIASLLCIIRMRLAFKHPTDPLDNTIGFRIGKIVMGLYFVQLFTRLAVYLSLAVAVEPQEGVATVIQGHCFNSLDEFWIIGTLHVLNNILLLPSACEFLAIAVALFYVIFNHWRKGILAKLQASREVSSAV